MADKVRRSKVVKEGAGPVIADSRFARLHTDPRFQKCPKTEGKLAVDSRFDGMFTDKRFQVNSKTDKRGRRKQKGMEEDLRRYYHNNDKPVSFAEDAAAGTSARDKKTDRINGKGQQRMRKVEEKDKVDAVGQRKFKASPSRIESGTDESDEDAIPGVAESDGEEDDERVEAMVSASPSLSDENLSSSTDDDSSSDDDVEEEEEEVEKVPTTKEETRRLAAVNLDWENLRAVDILVMMKSFLPKSGSIGSVTVYPSEFGLQQMREEEVHGPQGVFVSRDGGGGSDDEEDDEAEGINKKKLRDYEKSKLRYYFAVVECDSAATGNALYVACDGLEFEKSSNILDLRFIPDDMKFMHKPRDAASDVPPDYTPPDFTTRVLQHSNVRLTWDDDEPARVKALRRNFNADKQLEMDFRDYLASDSEDSDSDDGEEGKDDDDLPSGSKPVPEGNKASANKSGSAGTATKKEKKSKQERAEHYRKKSPVKSYKELSPEELLQCLREDEDELLSLLKEGDMKLQALGVNLDEKALPGDLGMPPLEKVSSAVESLPAVMESHSSMNSAQVSSISPEGHLNAKASDERDRGTDSLRGRGRGNGVEETGSGVRSSTESSRLRGMQQVEEKVMHGGSRAEATKRWVERDAGQAVGEPAMSVRGDGGNGMGARNHGLASSGGAVPGLRGVDVGGTGLSGGGVVGGERESGAAEKFVRKEGRRSPVLFEIEELEPLDRGWEVVESDKWKGKRPLSGSPGKRTGRQQNLLLRCSSTRSGGMGLERGAGASASGVKVGGFAGSKGERPHQREREYVTVAGDNRVPRGRDVPPLDERSAGRDGGGKERDSEVAMGGNDGVSLTNGSEAVGPRSELSGTEVGGLSREMEGGFPGGGVRGLWNGIGLQSRDSLPASSGDEEWDGSGRDFLSVQSERLSGVEDLVPGPNRGTIIRSSSDGSVECYQDSPTALDPPGLNDGEDEREVLPSDKRGYGVAGRELFEDAVGSLPDEDREVSFEGNSDREVAFLNAKFTLVEGREGGPSRSEQEHEVRGNLSAPTLEVGGVVRLGGSNSLRKRLLRTRDCVGLACLLQF